MGRQPVRASAAVTYYGVFSVSPRSYVAGSATSNEKLAREIADDLSNGRVIMPDGSERQIRARPHVAEEIRS